LNHFWSIGSAMAVPALLVHQRALILRHMLSRVQTLTGDSLDFTLTLLKHVLVMCGSFTVCLSSLLRFPVDF